MEEALTKCLSEYVPLGTELVRRWSFVGFGCAFCQVPTWKVLFELRTPGIPWTVDWSNTFDQKQFDALPVDALRVSEPNCDRSGGLVGPADCRFGVIARGHSEGRHRLLQGTWYHQR